MGNSWLGFHSIHLWGRRYHGAASASWKHELDPANALVWWFRLAKQPVNKALFVQSFFTSWHPCHLPDLLVIKPALLIFRRTLSVHL